ncbi:tRNA (adenine(22)-N(1))-methyltransferase [Nannocystaceae bacterium ST9]
MHEPLPRAELGPRLRTLADAVLPDLPVGDLCCDHARLAIGLVGEGRVPSAVAGDIASAPLVGAARAIAAAGLADRIALRRGDGFRVLEPGEVATVVLAGIGAALSARMLATAAREGRLAGVRRLVLHTDDGIFPRLGELRAQLAALDWGLVAETFALERGRFHLILVAEREGERVRDEVDRELGPLLRRREDPLFGAWRARELARVQKVLADMRTGRGEPGRRGDFERWLAMLQ